jgi:hypothetical protein
LIAAHDDLIYELLRRLLYARDFFDVSDLVSKDGEFSARYKLVDDIYDGLLDGQSSGVFAYAKLARRAFWSDSFRSYSDILASMPIRMQINEIGLVVPTVTWR